MTDEKTILTLLKLQPHEIAEVRQWARVNNVRYIDDALAMILRVGLRRIAHFRDPAHQESRRQPTILG